MVVDEAIEPLGNEEMPTDIQFYRLGREIGRGGFGVVFEALNTLTGERVAIKRLNLKKMGSSEIEDIESEIGILKQLKEKHIVMYIGTIEENGYIYIVTEWVEGGSLSSVVKRFGALNEGLAAIYIQQVLIGLEYLHNQGVLHRDIKAANMLVSKEGIVKLADFGVASLDTEKSDIAVGSPYWMAPEVIEMSGAITSAADIWSIGCTIVELVTGSPPYYDYPPMTALLHIVQDDLPPLPSSCSPALREFLTLCFRKQPAQRRSASELLQHPWLRQKDRTAMSMGSESGFSSSHSHSIGHGHTLSISTSQSSTSRHQNSRSTLMSGTDDSSIGIGPRFRSANLSGSTTSSGKDSPIAAARRGNTPTTYSNTPRHMHTGSTPSNGSLVTSGIRASKSSRPLSNVSFAGLTTASGSTVNSSVHGTTNSQVLNESDSKNKESNYKNNPRYLSQLKEWAENEDEEDDLGVSSNNWGPILHTAARSSTSLPPVPVGESITVPADIMEGGVKEGNGSVPASTEADSGQKLGLEKSPKSKSISTASSASSSGLVGILRKNGSSHSLSTMGRRNSANLSVDFSEDGTTLKPPTGATKPHKMNASVSTSAGETKMGSLSASPFGDEGANKNLSRKKAELAAWMDADDEGDLSELSSQASTNLSRGRIEGQKGQLRDHPSRDEHEVSSTSRIGSGEMNKLKYDQSQSDVSSSPVICGKPQEQVNLSSESTRTPTTSHAGSSLELFGDKEDEDIDRAFAKGIDSSAISATRLQMLLGSSASNSYSIGMPAVAISAARTAGKTEYPVPETSKGTAEDLQKWVDEDEIDTVESFSAGGATSTNPPPLESAASIGGHSSIGSIGSVSVESMRERLQLLTDTGSGPTSLTSTFSKTTSPRHSEHAARRAASAASTVAAPAPPAELDFDTVSSPAERDAEKGKTSRESANVEFSDEESLSDEDTLFLNALTRQTHSLTGTDLLESLSQVRAGREGGSHHGSSSSGSLGTIGSFGLDRIRGQHRASSSSASSSTASSSLDSVGFDGGHRERGRNVSGSTHATSVSISSSRSSVNSRSSPPLTPLGVERSGAVGGTPPLTGIERREGMIDDFETANTGETSITHAHAPSLSSSHIHSHTVATSIGGELGIWSEGDHTAEVQQPDYPQTVTDEVEERDPFLDIDDSSNLMSELRNDPESEENRARELLIGSLLDQLTGHEFLSGALTSALLKDRSNLRPKLRHNNKESNGNDVENGSKADTPSSGKTLKEQLSRNIGTDSSEKNGKSMDFSSENEANQEEKVSENNEQLLTSELNQQSGSEHVEEDEGSKTTAAEKSHQDGDDQSQDSKDLKLRQTGDSPAGTSPVASLSPESSSPSISVSTRKSARRDHMKGVSTATSAKSRKSQNNTVTVWHAQAACVSLRSSMMQVCRLLTQEPRMKEWLLRNHRTPEMLSFLRESLDIVGALDSYGRQSSAEPSATANPELRHKGALSARSGHNVGDANYSQGSLNDLVTMEHDARVDWAYSQQGASASNQEVTKRRRDAGFGHSGGFLESRSVSNSGRYSSFGNRRSNAQGVSPYPPSTNSTPSSFGTSRENSRNTEYYREIARSYFIDQQGRRIPHFVFPYSASVNLVLETHRKFWSQHMFYILLSDEGDSGDVAVNAKLKVSRRSSLSRSSTGKSSSSLSKKNARSKTERLRDVVNSLILIGGLSPQLRCLLASEAAPVRCAAARALKHIVESGEHALITVASCGGYNALSHTLAGSLKRPSVNNIVEDFLTLQSFASRAENEIIKHDSSHKTDSSTRKHSDGVSVESDAESDDSGESNGIMDIITIRRLKKAFHTNAKYIFEHVLGENRFDILSSAIYKKIPTEIFQAQPLPDVPSSLELLITLSVIDYDIVQKEGTKVGGGGKVNKKKQKHKAKLSKQSSTTSTNHSSAPSTNQRSTAIAGRNMEETQPSRVLSVHQRTEAAIQWLLCDSVTSTIGANVISQFLCLHAAYVTGNDIIFAFSRSGAFSALPFGIFQQLSVISSISARYLLQASFPSVSQAESKSGTEKRVSIDPSLTQLLSSSIQCLSSLIQCVLSFSRASGPTKAALCSLPLTTALLQVLSPFPPQLQAVPKFAAVSLAVVRALVWLSSEPSALDVLLRAGTFEVVIPLLTRELLFDSGSLDEENENGYFSRRLQEEQKANAGVDNSNTSTNASTSRKGRPSQSVSTAGNTSPCTIYHLEGPCFAEGLNPAQRGELLSALLFLTFNLCRVSPARQARACQCGLVTALRLILKSASPDGHLIPKSLGTMESLLQLVPPPPSPADGVSEPKGTGTSRAAAHATQSTPPTIAHSRVSQSQIARLQMLEPVAIPLLCDLAHGGTATTSYMRAANAQPLLCSLLDDPHWSMLSLLALSSWASTEDYSAVLGGARHIHNRRDTADEESSADSKRSEDDADGKEATSPESVSAPDPAKYPRSVDLVLSQDENLSRLCALFLRTSSTSETQVGPFTTLVHKCPLVSQRLCEPRFRPLVREACRAALQEDRAVVIKSLLSLVLGVLSGGEKVNLQLAKDTANDCRVLETVWGVRSRAGGKVMVLNAANLLEKKINELFHPTQ